jgi:N-methylhydantoinase A
MLFCDLKHDYTRSYYIETVKADLNKINELYGEMEKLAIDTLGKEGIAQKDVIIEKSMEMCYYGQFRQRVAKVPAGPVTKDSLAATINNFHEVHQNTLRYSDPKYPTEIVRLHLSGIAKVSKPQFQKIPRGTGDTSKALKGTRKTYFTGHGFIATKVYDGDKLLAGDVLEGPCILEEKFTTCVIPPKISTKVDSGGNYIIAI